MGKAVGEAEQKEACLQVTLFAQGLSTKVLRVMEMGG